MKQLLMSVDISQTKLPKRPEVKRGEPLNQQQWTAQMDDEGRIKDPEHVKDIIFRGVSFFYTDTQIKK